MYKLFWRIYKCVKNHKDILINLIRKKSLMRYCIHLITVVLSDIVNSKNKIQEVWSILHEISFGVCAFSQVFQYLFFHN
jgi:positive regulator of sigma E activity